MLDLDPTATVFCCDFSPRAVALVERRRQTLPADKRDRIVPFVCDVSREPLCGSSGPVPPGCVDVCTMVFVLSAIAPDRMPDVLRNVSSVMRPEGAGRVLLRDYADGDLAQRRLLDKGDGRKLGDNHYVRGDGTRAFYFEKRFVKDLFATQGMALEEMTVHASAVTNRADARRMDRRWLQCSFASAHVCAAPLPPPPPPPEPEWRRRAREAEAARAARAAREEEERAAREEEARVGGKGARGVGRVRPDRVGKFSGGAPARRSNNRRRDRGEARSMRARIRFGEGSAHARGAGGFVRRRTRDEIRRIYP